MIFQGVTRPDTAGLGVARPGEARPYVTQYGNWDNFLKVGLGPAGRGPAGRGKARQHACRWAVSPDTFFSNNQGNQSKTT